MISTLSFALAIALGTLAADSVRWVTVLVRFYWIRRRELGHQRVKRKWLEWAANEDES